MKKIFIISFLFTLIVVIFSSCEQEKIEEQQPIELKGGSEVFDFLNENSILEIPFSVNLDNGIKRAYYKVVKSIPDSYKIKVGPEIEIPVTNGNKLDEIISLVITEDLKGIVIVVVDKNDVISTRMVEVLEVKKAPIISFKSDIKHKRTLMVGTIFNIEGKVSSENEITRFNYITVSKQGKENLTAINLGDKRNIDFSVEIKVPNGLEYIIFEAENEFGGIHTDTFTVSNVVTEDFVSILMPQGITELDPFFDSLPNTVMGTIESWTDISSIEYSIVKDGVESYKQGLSIGENPGNYYNFSFDIEGQLGMQQVKIYTSNKGGKTALVTLNIPKVSNISDIKLIKNSKTKWKIVDFDSQHSPYVVTNVIDNNLSTFWHTPYNDDSIKHPHWFILDMGQEVSVGAIELFRRQGSPNGPSSIRLLYSQNGNDWNEFGMYSMKRDIDEGQLFYSTNIPVFPKTRYIKFEALESPNYFTMISEINVYSPEY